MASKTQEWEYEILLTSSTSIRDVRLRDTLNHWGSLGWEVCAAIADPCSGPVTLMFKRPKP